MPKATKEQSEATAATVLATARRLFAERGYAAVGLEEVAAEASVTRGAVYHHFDSKLGLFGAVHDSVQETVGADIAAATGGIAAPWESLVVGCRAFLSASVSDECRRILLVDAPAVLGWARWRHADEQHSARHLSDVLGELADAGEIAVSSVSAASALLSGAMNEAALWIAMSEDRDTAMAEAWQTLHAMLGALRASDA